MKRIFCFIGIHCWEIGAHVEEITTKYVKRNKNVVEIDRIHNHHRECKWCKLTQDLVRPKEYHPTKYVWITRK